MAIYETFSTRQKKLSKQGDPDPYRYDVFPQPLRVQVINLLNSILGNYNRHGNPDPEADPRWDHIHGTLAHEYGIVELAKGRDSQQRCVTFFSEISDVEKCLDFVEIGFRWVRVFIKKYAKSQGGYAKEQEECEQAIKELNFRLREHSLGYQFEDGMIIRVDSQFIHAEIIKPALALLHDIGFAGVSEEYLQAHEGAGLLCAPLAGAGDRALLCRVTVETTHVALRPFRTIARRTCVRSNRAMRPSHCTGISPLR